VLKFNPTLFFFLTFFENIRINNTYTRNKWDRCRNIYMYGRLGIRREKNKEKIERGIYMDDHMI